MQVSIKVAAKLPGLRPGDEAPAGVDEGDEFITAEGCPLAVFPTVLNMAHKLAEFQVWLWPGERLFAPAGVVQLCVELRGFEEVRSITYPVYVLLKGV